MTAYAQAAESAAEPVPRLSTSSTHHAHPAAQCAAEQDAKQAAEQAAERAAAQLLQEEEASEQARTKARAKKQRQKLRKQACAPLLPSMQLLGDLKDDVGHIIAG